MALTVLDWFPQVAIYLDAPGTDCHDTFMLVEYYIVLSEILAAFGEISESPCTIAAVA